MLGTVLLVLLLLSLHFPHFMSILSFFKRHVKYELCADSVMKICNMICAHVSLDHAAYQSIIIIWLFCLLPTRSSNCILRTQTDHLCFCFYPFLLFFFWNFTNSMYFAWSNGKTLKTRCKQTKNTTLNNIHSRN